MIVLILQSFLLLLSISACSRQYKIAKIIPGNTSIQSALTLLDEPEVAEKSSLNSNFETFIWRDVSLHVHNSIVKTIHREPASHEKTIQFWKQEHKKIHTSFDKVSNQVNGQESLWKFNIPSKGINVIYNENLDQVTRVIYYEVQ